MEAAYASFSGTTQFYKWCPWWSQLSVENLNTMLIIERRLHQSENKELTTQCKPLVSWASYLMMIISLSKYFWSGKRIQPQQNLEPGWSRCLSLLCAHGQDWATDRTGLINRSDPAVWNLILGIMWMLPWFRHWITSGPCLMHWFVLITLHGFWLPISQKPGSSTNRFKIKNQTRTSTERSTTLVDPSWGWMDGWMIDFFHDTYFMC